MAPTLADVEVGLRFRVAGQLDEIVRELQVLQGALRGDRPGMPLATVSTGLIGAKLTLTEVIDTLGATEAEAISVDMLAPDREPSVWTPAPAALGVYDHLDVADV